MVAMLTAEAKDALAAIIKMTIENLVRGVRSQPNHFVALAVSGDEIAPNGGTRVAPALGATARGVLLEVCHLPPHTDRDRLRTVCLAEGDGLAGLAFEHAVDIVGESHGLEVALARFLGRGLAGFRFGRFGSRIIREHEAIGSAGFGRFLGNEEVMRLAALDGLAFADGGVRDANELRLRFLFFSHGEKVV